MQAFEVISAGILTTVQDLGRRGYRRFGLPRSGAADGFSLQLANILVGNPRDAAGLECTAVGPTLRVLGPALVSCTGAFAPVLNGSAWPPDVSFWVNPGDTLELRPTGEGLRGYLGVSGGIDVPVVMGSRSTCLKAGFGGYHGRALQAGDVLACRPGPGARPARAPAGRETGCGPLRVILGPQDDLFTREGLAALLESEYRVTSQCDRMGCRLQGPPVTHSGRADILSDGVPEGSIQVPGNAQPIILLCDGQPTGGYAKPAVVISADLGRAAQLAPGATVSFAQATREKARAALLCQQAYLDRAERLAQAALGSRLYQLRVQGRAYRVQVEELP
ncbi:MAG: biotin-dependent carboxyltransferase family protein [Bacillota bacterium]